MPIRKLLSANLTAENAVIIGCSIVFSVGLLVGGIGLSERKKYHREYVSARSGMARKVLYDAGFRQQLIDWKASLISSQGPALKNEPRGDESLNSLSGIEISSDIQSFIHHSREVFDDAQIEVEDRSFGFSDYVREVAVVNEEKELVLLRLQLEQAQTLLGVLSTCDPIALVSLRRDIDTREISEEKGVNSTKHSSEKSPSTLQYELKMTVEFDGYTRAFRSFLNTVIREHEDLQVVGIQVSRSFRSEEDRTLLLMESDSSNSQSERNVKSRSPFAAYLQSDLDEPSKPLAETKPLIGEVVSRFLVEFEKGVFLQ